MLCMYLLLHIKKKKTLRNWFLASFALEKIVSQILNQEVDHLNTHWSRSWFPASLRLKKRLNIAVRFCLFVFFINILKRIETFLEEKLWESDINSIKASMHVLSTFCDLVIFHLISFCKNVWHFFTSFYK